MSEGSASLGFTGNGTVAFTGNTYVNGKGESWSPPTPANTWTC